MVNQNPEPIILSENIEIQAGANTGNIELMHNMAAPEILNIFAVYCYIYPGYLDIGADTDFPAGRRTWTDIDPIYIPVRDNDQRPRDDEEPNPLYVTLPVCCNPRPWTDLTLEIIVGNNPVPSKIINLGVIASKLDRTLPFSVPVKVKWNQKLYIKVTNSNPATPANWTFTKLDISLNGDITNFEQLRKEKMLRQIEDAKAAAAAAAAAGQQ